MSFSVSPSVDVREFNTQQVASAITASYCGIVGNYKWGPVLKRKLVTNETELLRYFGLPDDTVYKHWYSAAEFLRYASTLYVVRAIDADVAKNSGIGVTGEGQPSATISISTNPYIPNDDNIPTISFGANEKLQIVARYPGTYGNANIKIAIANADDFPTANIVSGTTFVSQFEYAPTSSIYDKYDQIAIAVLLKNDLDDNFQIVERWVVDLDPNARDALQKSNYIETVINRSSQYIYVFDNTTIELSPQSFEAVLLSGGVDGTPSTGDIQTGYDLFANPNDITISFLMDGGNDNETIQSYITTITGSRRDGVAVHSVPDSEYRGLDISTAVDNIVTYKTETLAASSTYEAIYANSKKIYDKYNDVYRWIPISGDVAGLMAQLSTLYEPWSAPAGYTRGVLKNTLEFAINPSETYRDVMYPKSINFTITDENGHVILGQKTATLENSPFNRLNVRLLFITVEKAIANVSKFFLFEENSDYTRNRMVLTVDPLLRDIQSRGGIFEYIVKCDTDNNPGSVQDQNQLIVDIYIKPTRIAEFIRLNFTAVGTDVSFDEIIRG